MTELADHGPGAAGGWRSLLAGSSAQFGLLGIIVILWLVFGSLAPGFTSPFNLFALGRTLAVDIVIGFSMMVVLATGGMNLAVGAIGAGVVMLGGWLMEAQGVPVPLAVLLALAVGALLGWINGAAVIATGINSFVITLATSSLYYGLMLILTKAEAYRALPDLFTALGKARLGTALSPLLLITLATGALLFALYRFTTLGRQILAAGANARAAALSGVPVGRIIRTSHALSGLMAGLAGLMLTSRLGSALPSTGGPGGSEWLLPAFLAPILGGTLLSGGAVSVIGTMLGAALVTTINSGLLMLQVGNFWIQLFLGLILLVAVIADRWRGLLVERRALRRR